MTVEYLQPLLDHNKSFFLPSGKILQVLVSVRDAIRLGRLTVLQKLDNGVRGIVAGDVVRRLVARTMSQQLMEDVEHATAPFQYVCSMRAGCECIAHVLQVITDLDPRATVTSIDEAMLQGIQKVHGAAVPFVSMFCGTASTYLWEDDEGTTHKIQG